MSALGVRAANGADRSGRDDRRDGGGRPRPLLLMLGIPSLFLFGGMMVCKGALIGGR